jgi:hypothetical protein
MGGSSAIAVMDDGEVVGHEIEEPRKRGRSRGCPVGERRDGAGRGEESIDV